MWFSTNESDVERREKESDTDNKLWYSSLAEDSWVTNRGLCCWGYWQKTSTINIIQDSKNWSVASFILFSPTKKGWPQIQNSQAENWFCSCVCVFPLLCSLCVTVKQRTGEVKIIAGVDHNSLCYYETTPFQQGLICCEAREPPDLETKHWLFLSSSGIEMYIWSDTHKI